MRGLPFSQTFVGAVIVAAIGGLIVLFVQKGFFDGDPPRKASAEGQVQPRHDRAERRSAEEPQRADPDIPKQDLSKQQTEATRRAEEALARERASEDARRKAAEQARREAEAQEARRRTAEDAAARICPQSDRLPSLAGRRVRVEYNTDPHDLQAGRAVRRMLANLNATAVAPSEPADLTVSIGARVSISETIGNRHADANLTLNWRVANSNVPCGNPVSANGSGVGPTFDAASERAIDAAIAGLERQLSRSFSANRP